jgi:hypothetical protein
MSQPHDIFLEGSLDQVVANRLSEHAGAVRRCISRMLTHVGVPAHFIGLFEGKTLDNALTFVANHCIDALAARFAISVPGDLRPTITLSEGMPATFANVAGHHSIYDPTENAIRLASNDIVSGRAYFDVASRFLRALSTGQIGEKDIGEESVVFRPKWHRCEGR